MDGDIKAMAYHPGEIIRDELEERGWSQRDLAYILGKPEQSVNTIVAGKRGISAEMAKALEQAFDVPAEFFLNLQKAYDLSRAEEPEPEIAKRARFYRSSYPVREMIRRGWLEDADPSLLETQMARFFGVTNIRDIPHMRHAAKKTNYEEMPTSQLAWLFRVKQIANSIAAPAYSEKKLRQAMLSLGRLLIAPEEIRHVPRILMDCGVRFVVVEALPQAKIDGVCFWLNNVSPVVGLSIRYDRIDNFWFVLRHEIEHVLNKDGQNREIMDAELEGERADANGPVSSEEKLANAAAAEFCVPRNKMESFVARKSPYISERDVVGFANIMQVHPGIIVGQLHAITKDYRYFRKLLVKIREYVLASALVDGWGNVAPVSL